ncbi:MAG: mechanosensitive ion channel domain-containing protein [Chloroflexota bacterium]
MDFLNEFWTQLTQLGTQFGASIISAVAIFFIGYQVAKFLRRLAQNGIERSSLDATLSKFAINIVYYAVLAFVIMAALDQLGVDTNSFLAIIGAAGLTAGLAMEGTLANFVAGVLLILLRPFKEGDYVEVGDVRGKIEDIAVLQTRLVTFENEVVILPNRDVTDGKIINFSTKDFVELELSFFVDFAADLEEAIAILQDAADASPYTIDDPRSAAHVFQMHQMAVELMLEANILPQDRERATFDLNKRIITGFQKQGIAMPQQRWVQNPVQAES